MISKRKTKLKNNIFKCFGISKSDVMSLLSSLLSENHGVILDIIGKGLLTDISLKANENNVYFYEFTRIIFEKLNPYIYSENDLSLEETAIELMKINKLTLATAESVTGGQIVSNLIKNNLGASQVVIEGLVTYSNQSKCELLNVSKETLDKHTSVSVQTTYDMAEGLLELSKADVVIATTGYASSVKENEEKGLVFIAIGNKNRIDVYKNKFSGTRNEIIETAAQAAIFYLIKKLRKNDFYLEENEI